METSLLPFIERWKTRRLDFCVAERHVDISTFLFFRHKFISLLVHLFNPGTFFWLKFNWRRVPTDAPAPLVRRGKATAQRSPRLLHTILNTEN